MSYTDYISNYQIIIFFAMLISVVGDVKHHRKLRILSYFLIFTTIFELGIANIQWYLQHRNHEAFFINAHGCILFYYLIFRKEHNSKLLEWLMKLWIIISLIYAITVEITDKTILTYTLGLILIAAVILSMFKKLIIASPYKNIWKNYKFWLGVSILSFLACSFPLLVFLDLLVINDSVELAFFDLLTVGNVILSMGYLISAIMLWKQR
ncbi:MAG: hypothetical protein AAGA77_18135 [Bacteroidota bacterium]